MERERADEKEERWWDEEERIMLRFVMLRHVLAKIASFVILHRA